MTDAALVEAAIVASGLSARKFATRMLARNERTVRRWSAGAPIDGEVRDWLERWLALSESERARIVKSLSR